MAPVTTSSSTSKFVLDLGSGDRIALSKAITLMESKRTEDRTAATELLQQLLPSTGRSIRIGITGVPGAGKSTFIEVFGKHLTGLQKKVAVLAIDPSSTLTKGSILGDKTRMPLLANDPLAYIRPSPSGETIGGIARRTRENVLLCEAAGFEVVIVETVGVGQAEAAVKNMVDFFLLLLPPGAGDELQGMKRGIVEMADALLITKADGDLLKAASRAQADYRQAIHLLPVSDGGWTPEVLSCSAIEGKGVEEIWAMIHRFQMKMTETGNLQKRRADQNIAWFHELFTDLWEDVIHEDKDLSSLRQQLEAGLSANAITPGLASQRLWELLSTRLFNKHLFKH